ncbi:MAG: hypothetical protein V1855_03625, partial [bacterium]
KKNESLAKSYYKLAMLELSDLSTNQDESKHAYKKALSYINQAIDQQKHPRYLAFKATLLFELGREKESFAFFDLALQACTDQQLKTEILNNYACLCAQHGKEKKALQIWNDLEKNESYLTPEVALVNQGKYYVNKDDLDKAHELFLKASNVNPSYLDAHFYCALVAYKRNDLFLARDKLTTVLLLEPKHKGAEQFSVHIENLLSQKSLNTLL